MQAPSPGTTLSPIWNQVGTIAGAIAAVFTVLFWAGITPSVLHQHGRSAVKSRPKEYSILVGSCITISLAIPAFLEYVQLHSVYPIAAWTIVGILCSLIATNWILVWRSSRKPLHSLDNSPLTPLQIDILALSREL